MKVIGWVLAIFGGMVCGGALIQTANEEAYWDGIMFLTFFTGILMLIIGVACINRTPKEFHNADDIQVNISKAQPSTDTFEEQSYDIRKSIGNFLLFIAACDGEINEKEWQWLNKFLSSMSVSKEECYSYLKSNSKEVMFSDLRALNYSRKKYLIAAVLDLINCDGKTNETESSVLVSFFNKLGIPKDELVDIIKNDPFLLPQRPMGFYEEKNLDYAQTMSVPAFKEMNNTNGIEIKKFNREGGGYGYGMVDDLGRVIGAVASAIAETGKLPEKVVVSMVRDKDTPEADRFPLLHAQGEGGETVFKF